MISVKISTPTKGIISSDEGVSPMKKDSGSSGVGTETGAGRGTALREVEEQGLPRSCFRNLRSPRMNSFGSVLDVHQVYLDQPGLYKPHSTVCVAGCGNTLHGEGVPQSSFSGQFVCSLITICFQW